MITWPPCAGYSWITIVTPVRADYLRPLLAGLRCDLRLEPVVLVGDDLLPPEQRLAGLRRLSIARQSGVLTSRTSSSFPC